MARISPIHYIQPSAIGIVTNANGNADDIAVAINAGAKIKVFAPQAGIKTSNGTYREWTLEGRNRRLADSTKEYTIYARLTKQEGYSAYIVFAPKTWRDGEWRDKYPYVTVNGLTVGESPVDGPYWYVKIGDVSLPENGLRTVTLDTGILGMEEFNTQWALNPDALPLRVELDCKVGGKAVGLSPYLFWGQSLTLTAVLKEGWTGSDLSRFHHWQITRDSGDTTADEEWNASSRLESFANTGIIRLSHERNSDDDFNGAVSASYTIVAMEQQESEDPEIEYEYVPLASTTIHIMAETSEVFSLSFSTAIVSLNPQSGAITPSGGVVVLVRATDQRNRVFDLTVGQLRSAGITVSYAPVGSDTWTPLVFSGESTDIATATIAASVFAATKKSVNVRVTRPVPSEDDPEVMVEKELNRATLAFVRDGEDSHEREWIFLRSTEPITFGDAESEHPLPSLIARGEVNPSGAAAGSDTDKNQEGWVPNGWWDDMRGTTKDVPYEYGAYRDFVNDDNGGHWGDFVDPTIWGHYGKDGRDGQDGRDADSVRTNILLRTVFDKGIDFVKEAWTGDFNHVFIDGASDTPIEGHKCIRINASTLPTGEFADFNQNVIARVKPATWYTLSFNYFSTGGSTNKFFETFVWSGASGYTAIDVSEGMYIDGVHQSAAATRGDGCVQWPSDWTGKRHSVTFKTVGTFNTDYVNILFRCNAGGQAAICMPKLEEGKTATAYMANDDDLIGKDGKDGQDGTDGRDGQDGTDGKDGWMITANPANVIITQAMTNASASFSSAVVGFAARKGSADDSFVRVIDVTSTEFNVSLETGQTPGKVIVSSPKTHTPEGSTEQVYYTEGSFVARIEATDPDTNQSVIFAVTVLCYANLLGTWKTVIEGDVETSVAQKITYGYDHETGQVGSLEAVGKYIRSSEKNISTLQKDTAKKNLFPIKGWRLNDSGYSATDYDKAYDRSYDEALTTNDIYSPVIELSEGDYCFSGYVPSERSFDTYGNTIQVVYGCSAADPASGSQYINAKSVGELTGDTIKINGNIYTKRYAVFSIPATAMCSINLWGDTGYGDVAQPKIVAGTTPEVDTTMSVISQTAEEINQSVSNLSESTQTALNLKANSADLTTMHDGLETAGVHLDGENSKLRLNAETTEISGDLFVPRVETTGNPNRKIVIDSETFRVYNKDNIAGISIGWDTDGEPFLLFTNADGSRYVRISYSDIDIAGSQFTADAFAQLYYLPVVSGSTRCDWKLYGNNYDEYTQYYRYSAAKNTATGVYSSEIPDRPGQYLTIYQRRRSERDGKVMTTNVLSDVLGETTQYIANGYYVSHMYRPVSREQEARGIVCKYIWPATLGNVPTTSLQVTYMQKIETQEGDYEYMFCNADASDAAYVFDANRFIFNI